MCTKKAIHQNRQEGQRISLRNKMFKKLKIDQFTPEINLKIDKFNQKWLKVYDDMCFLFELV